MLNVIPFFLNFTLEFAEIIGKIVGSLLAFLSALIGLHWGLHKFYIYVIGEGTTSNFSRDMKNAGFTNIASRWDRLTYRPYKGYNRLRSQKWNMEHTMQ